MKARLGAAFVVGAVLSCATLAPPPSTTAPAEQPPTVTHMGSYDGFDHPVPGVTAAQPQVLPVVQPPPPNPAAKTAVQTAQRYGVDLHFSDHPCGLTDESIGGCYVAGTGHVEVSTRLLSPITQATLPLVRYVVLHEVAHHLIDEACGTTRPLGADDSETAEQLTDAYVDAVLIPENTDAEVSTYRAYGHTSELLEVAEQIAAGTCAGLGEGPA